MIDYFEKNNIVIGCCC